MDIVKSAIKCTLCSSVLEEPVILPCGYSVCLKHLQNLQNETIRCKPCNEDHRIEKSYVNVSKSLDVLIKANFENQKLSPDYYLAFDQYNKLDERINDMETLRNDPSRFVKQTIDKLKNKSDLIRKDYISKIDQRADHIIEQLEKYEKECITNLDSSHFKSKMTDFDKNITNIKETLAKWYNQLNDFSTDNNVWQTIIQTNNKSDWMLRKQECSFKNEILNQRLSHLFTCIFKFHDIQLKSEKRFDNERNEFLQTAVDQVDFNSKIIDQVKKEQLCNLCNFASNQNWKLIYRSTGNDLKAKDFHFWCDDVANTLTIIKSGCGNIFGGYASQPWDQSNTVKRDSNAFLFSLVNPQNVPEKLNIQNPSAAIYCREGFPPAFGQGHELFIDYNSGGYSRLGSSYPKRKIQENDERLAQYFTKSEKFTILLIEIFQILPCINFFN